MGFRDVSGETTLGGSSGIGERATTWACGGWRRAERWLRFEGRGEKRNRVGFGVGRDAWMGIAGSEVRMDGHCAEEGDCGRGCTVGQSYGRAMGGGRTWRTDCERLQHYLKK
jgi:hypothetical protein